VYIMAAPPPNTTTPNLPPKGDANPVEQRGYIPADTDTYYNRRPSKLVRERPIHPVPTATGALPPTGPNGASLSKETSNAKTLIDPDALPEGLHPRDSAIKHPLLDDYRVWNTRWLETEIVNNKATLETLPAILGSGKELEERFRLCLRDEITVEASVLEALREQYEELKAQLEYTRGVIGKLENRGRKAERRRAAAVEKARRKAEGGSVAVGEGRGEGEGKIEGVDGEDAAEKSEKATTEIVGPCKPKKVSEVSATTKAGPGVEYPVDLTMSCTPAQDDVEDVAPKKSTLGPGHPSAADNMARKHSHGSRGKRSGDYAVSTTHPEKERGDSSAKRNRDEEFPPLKRKGHKGTGHGTGVGDVENGLAVRKVKRARSTGKGIEEAPDSAQQALNGRRRNVLKALLRIP
jgi:hypothetical protein